VSYTVYDEGLVTLGGVDIKSINVPTSTFAANLNTARSPNPVFFSPPFNPNRIEYTIKLDPNEQAIFVSPSIFCERSQSVFVQGGVLLLRPVI
jgi:hypothetical protein